MGNIKELLLGAAYVGCIIGVAYVTLVSYHIFTIVWPEDSQRV